MHAQGVWFPVPGFELQAFSKLSFFTSLRFNIFKSSSSLYPKHPLIKDAQARTERCNVLLTYTSCHYTLIQQISFAKPFLKSIGSTLSAQDWQAIVSMLNISYWFPNILIPSLASVSIEYTRQVCSPENLESGSSPPKTEDLLQYLYQIASLFNLILQIGGFKTFIISQFHQTSDQLEIKVLSECVSSGLLITVFSPCCRMALCLCGGISLQTHQ